MTLGVTLGVAGDVSTLIGPRMVPQEESLLAAVVPGQPLFVVVLVAVVWVLVWQEPASLPV